jgi:hypothetical protein
MTELWIIEARRGGELVFDGPQPETVFGISAIKGLKAGFASVMWASGSELNQPWHFVSDPLGGKNHEAHVFVSKTEQEAKP